MADRLSHLRRVFVGSKVQFGLACKCHPQKGKRVARRQAERTLDMCLHLLGMTDVQLCVSDRHQSLSQIPVERQARVRPPSRLAPGDWN